MRKIFCAFYFVFLLFVMPETFAEDFNWNSLIELAKSNNIDVNEVVNSAYIGKSFDQIKHGDLPVIMVFADFSDFATVAKYANDGYFIYNNLQHDYGFTVFNVKNPENEVLVEKFKIKKVPYLFLANPAKNEIVPIKPALYENPVKMVRSMRAYLKNTRNSI